MGVNDRREGGKFCDGRARGGTSPLKTSGWWQRGNLEPLPPLRQFLAGLKCIRVYPECIQGLLYTYMLDWTVSGNPLAYPDTVCQLLSIFASQSSFHPAPSLLQPSQILANLPDQPQPASWTPSCSPERLQPSAR